MTPDEYTNQEFFIDVGDGHELYVQDWGNVECTIPVIHLHGGPGNGTRDSSKQMYNPLRQRVIFFDQRGAGKSLPYGSLLHNTTQDLVKDISHIADKLNLKQFVLFGSSWGSLLALAYAIAHPDKVHALVISGVFTGTKQEIDWLNEGAFRTFFPEVWNHFIGTVPHSHQNDPADYHISRVLGENEKAAKESAYAYANLELSLLKLDDRKAIETIETFDPTPMKIELHYLANSCFIPERYIFNHADKLTMPTYIVQGRYDMVCPPNTAYELHQKLPRSELIWTTSGHLSERETWNVLRIILMNLTIHT